MNNTAITDLIDFLRSKQNLFPVSGNKFERHMRGAYTDAIVKAMELLPKEKEQICLSWEDGYYSNSENLQNQNEKYYNDTYDKPI